MSLTGYNIWILSFKDFLEKVDINDTITCTGTDIEWTLKDKDRVVKIWNNHDTFLININISIFEICSSIFHPDDVHYACEEIYYYLHFAFYSFKKRLQSVNYYGFGGPFIPLFTQWNALKNILEDIKTPEYYIGPNDILPWDNVVINTDPYDVTYWQIEGTDKSIGTNQYVFAYKRPLGIPIFVYVTPFDSHIINADTNSPLQNSISSRLKEKSLEIAKYLGISFGELLFFIEEKEITFGAATPRIINASSLPNFKQITIDAFIKSFDELNIEKYDLAYFNLEATEESCEPNDSNKIVAIGDTKDHTMMTVVNSQAFTKSGLFLHIKDITKTWNFTYENGTFCIIYNNEKLDLSSKIYYRGEFEVFSDSQTDCLIETKNLLAICLDSLNCTVYGSSKTQYLNASKPLQIVKVMKFITENSFSSITIPSTKIIKGKDQYNNLMNTSIGDESENFIVKSISGIRSIVASEKEFKNWDIESINNLPCMFQNHINGMDLRVHVCNKKVFCVQITGKAMVDYRYSDGCTYEVVTIPPELEAFARTLSNYERNPLIGIDIIETKGKYFVLESNQMPGWDHFYNIEDHNEVIENFSRQIVS